MEQNTKLRSIVKKLIEKQYFDQIEQNFKSCRRLSFALLLNYSQTSAILSLNILVNFILIKREYKANQQGKIN